MTELDIKILGRKGDGIAQENGGDVFVPFTLTGETVTVTGTGPRRTMETVKRSSPNRIEPVCQHFTVCGGCQLQHMKHDAYLDWKTTLAMEPLQKIGISVEAEPMLSFDIATRRKAVFNLVHDQGGTKLGFTERASNNVVPIKECPIIVPEILDQLAKLQDLANSIPTQKTGTRMSVFTSSNGLDVSVDGAAGLSTDQRQVLIRKTIANAIARLSIDGEVLIETKKPHILIDGIPVIPPPGSFVQASKHAENAMVEIVTTHLKSCKNVADLYSGVGTFALPLSRKSMVWAVEENKSALNALDQAWRETGGKLKQIKTEARNLERRPVTFGELKKFDGLVFDPPRAGAEPQVKQIAKSKIQKIAAVSCNPVTLARDLEILLAGGFKVEKIIPIDQFRYTPHVEMVVTLDR